MTPKRLFWGAVLMAAGAVPAGGPRLGGVPTGAQEVPYVAQQPEVGVPHRCVELLHPL